MIEKPVVFSDPKVPETVTYDQIRQANATIRTTDVRGKEYAEVNQRVKAFRMLWPDGYIKTEMLSNYGDIGKHTCIFRATVGYIEPMTEQDVVLATGTAYEHEGSSNINRTSYIENCETSAVGRALGFLGLGVDVAIASAEEVQNAIAAQDAAQRPQEAARAPKEEKEDRITGVQAKTLLSLLEANGLSLPALLGHYKVANEFSLTNDQYKDALDRIQRWAQKQKKEEEK